LVSTVSRRSRQNGPSILTSAKLTGVKRRIGGSRIWRSERGNAGAAGIADDQRAGQPANAGETLAGDELHHLAARLAAHFVEVHVDAGQRRAGRLGDDLPVVEADQGDILRDGNPALAERIGNAARDLVVATEDRIGRVTP